MPLNLQAAIRYKVIDRCLRDHSKIWNWEKFADECTKEEVRNGELMTKPSKRTIDADISDMKSGRLGYEAPIVWTKELGYRYSNSTFSISNVSLSKKVINDLKEAIHILRQITKNDKLFSINESIITLQQKINLQNDSSPDNAQALIYLDESLNEAGQKWLDKVYNYITKKQSIHIQYNSFSQGQIVSHIISPWFIKEYNNRWYVFGQNHLENKIYNLALDRITDIKPSLQAFVTAKENEISNHFNYLFGVTIFDGISPQKVVFKTTTQLSKYMDTKPIHPTQIKSLMEGKNDVYYELNVYINYEIISKLLSFGDDLEVMSPPSLRAEMRAKVLKMAAKYADS